jgi:hypothetical protein
MPPCFAWLFVQLGCTHIGGSQFFEAETIGETQKKAKRWCQFPSWLGGWNFRKKWGSHLALSKTDGLALISSNGASENDGSLVYPHGLNSPMFCTPKTDLETRPTPLRFLGYPYSTSLSGDVIRSKLLLEKSLTPKQWMLWDREWSNLMVLWHPQNWIVYPYT